MTLDVSLTAPRWSVSAMTRSMKAKGILMTSYTMEKNSNYSLCLFPTEAKAGSEKIKLCVRRYCWRLHLLRQRRCSQHCCFTCSLSASFDGSRRCQPSDGIINETFNWRNYITSRLFPRLRHNEPINYAQKLALQLDAAVECFWRWLLIRQARSLSRYTNSWFLAQFLISSLNFQLDPFVNLTSHFLRPYFAV